ncbi:uncharacterized protein Z518_01347 [Rhinocladiella mackenziei CBS 650.93]|uniref:tRNA (uracil-O(2)-)-methyltransferase n=1 Tax=Rhinocladiella mackenziei CBS 650.93 TaxID=1442369 RepID=A0A0D2J3G4_9EURO|nr:uncharacterized protein Z518_01347 [Rhinocladiella mackenziei CBS 650.93]KIX10266.1 hypothetical protein Z518_01347 [Rhinocladiella mackenziei CBS 650.93]
METTAERTLSLSRLSSPESFWQTAQDYQQCCPDLGEDKFMQLSNLLLENPNLNSTHLFRADILYDSAGVLKTAAEKEKMYQLLNESATIEDLFIRDEPESTAVAHISYDAILERRVLRKLIPRKPQLDHVLDQWCYIYKLVGGLNEASGFVVVYVPDVKAESEMPWYHPPVKSLAYLYETKGSEALLSVHFLPFTQSSVDSLPSRLHRTFISLLQTFLRLAKNPAPKHAPAVVNGDTGGNSPTDLSMTPSALKDTILPQHIVQDTYSRLKQQYARDLMSRWAEKTEPSKHVFEDLSIAAFLIELWKQMYKPDNFPGFADIACGNGVLSYVLIKEGYHGRGFDARRRVTWEVLEMDEYLDEMICVPQPLLDRATDDIAILLPGTQVHHGLFKPGTFIISNHADELTPWTSILAALSSPESPLPFLAIPCCSHALSGAKHRYSPKDIHAASPSTSVNGTEAQFATGDLRALRATKAKATDHTDAKSMYACLTRKVVALAEEVGFDVELTLMRIPSTRNFGIVGNRKKVAALQHSELKGAEPNEAEEGNMDMGGVIQNLVDRECAMSGGVREAARTWIERAQKLQTGAGRGKVNLGGKPGHVIHD